MTSATTTVVFVTLIAWIVARTKLPGRKLLDFLAFVPVAVPGIVLGISLIWLYLSFPLPIYGTLWIIWFAYMIKYMPIVMRIMSAAIAQVHPEMEEASMICSSWFMTLRRVLFPLLRPGLVAGELTGELVQGGRSNLTYAMTDGRHNWAVRRPPLGHVLSTSGASTGCCRRWAQQRCPYRPPSRGARTRG